MAAAKGDPTPEQIYQASLAAAEVVELVNRLLREGMPPDAVLSGVANAVADTITCLWGAKKVAPWFDGMAENVRELQRPN